MDKVNKCLADLLAQKAKLAVNQHERYQDLIKTTAELIGRGGKRLRPQIVLESYRAYGGRNQSGIVKVAASQELFHAFILMHDDIIDRDLVRWGGPNISGRYVNEFAKYTTIDEARHYADSWALLAGDLCYSLSFELLLKSGFRPAQLNKAIHLVQQTLFEMVGGEVIDVSSPIFDQLGDSQPDEHFLNLYYAKTSSYTFCTPLRIGAMLAGAGVSQDRCLAAFGRHIGTAFQIRDDLLDIYGSEKQIGKSTLSDIREGKRTLLMNYGFMLASPSQRSKLERTVGDPEASLADLKVVRDILTANGAKARTEKVMQKQTQAAHHVLLKAGFPSSLNDYLAEMLSFAIKRSR